MYISCRPVVTKFCWEFFMKEGGSHDICNVCYIPNWYYCYTVYSQPYWLLQLYEHKFFLLISLHHMTWIELNCMININMVQGCSQDCMKGVARIRCLILSVLRNLSCWSSACELETWCYIYSNQWSIIPEISLFEHR